MGINAMISEGNGGGIWAYVILLIFFSKHKDLLPCFNVLNIMTLDIFLDENYWQVCDYKR